MGTFQPELISLSNHTKAVKTNTELINEITLLAGQINASTYRFLKLIAEFDRREAWGDGGIRSCAHWLHYNWSRS